MVWAASQAVKIPIIGMGGIRTWEDAIEFFLAGATAVSVGTAIFQDPRAPLEILEGIHKYLESHQYSRITEIIGQMEGT